MPNKKFSGLRSRMSPESQSQARAKIKPLQSDAPQDETLLEAMIEQMNKTTAQASHALDEALALVADSNRRIAGMEPTVTHCGFEPLTVFANVVNGDRAFLNLRQSLDG